MRHFADHLMSRYSILEVGEGEEGDGGRCTGRAGRGNVGGGGGLVS